MQSSGWSPRTPPTYHSTSTTWWNDNLEVTDTLKQDGTVALFGRFTLRSMTLGKTTESPFAVLAKVKDGRIAYFQYMEDTFATARTFREAGTWTIRADPTGPDPIEV